MPSSKGSLFVGETTSLPWLLVLFTCHVFRTNATDAPPTGPSTAAVAPRQRPDTHDSISEVDAKSTTRVLTQCQVICQVTFCWDLCERNAAENGNRHEEKIFPRVRRRAPSIGTSRDNTRRPSYDSSTAAAIAAEDASSGSGGGTESMSSSVSVSGLPLQGSNSGYQSSVETTSAAGQSSIGSAAAAIAVAVNMTVKVEVEKSGELHADLYFRLTSETNWSNGTIRVHLASETCNHYANYPHCTEPNRHLSIAVLADSNKWMKYRFAGLLRFNAIYWTSIDVGKETSRPFKFETPGCSRLDKQNYNRCAVIPNTLPKKDPPNPALLVRIQCMAYNREDNHVSIEIQWNVDPQPNVQWSSNVIVLSLPDKNPLLTKLTDRQEMRIADLPANRLYEILVSAKSKELEIIYEPLSFNTSEEKLKRLTNKQICPSTGSPTTFARVDSVSMRTDEGSKDAVLIGSLIFISLSMAGVVFFVYRKCKGVHMNQKAMISQTNSYKSSPSGSPRLLREGQPFNPNVDEWEIDPREVHLGVEIGQGAFGRVLTGYYKDKEIAIKVLRENIPEFYREDLLREIYLMKGLGYHPNIVTMLGACTIREPIALIVEYMPFGNLQTFLKKCRLDRETQTPDKRGEMLYCLLDEMTGVKESWQIAPTDILSFARQVVLAMQYLAERHYVHRDLAARNILLGNNKVVKVCDFGLARMVYTGDQYFKVTSGRLPLKWMALESIRDRVFTTHSDVWSFGVLLWEMVNMGASPYPGIALVDLYRLLAEGYRMQQPVNCSDELYDIISQCWCENPTDRPTFARIRTQLETLLARNVDYLDLDNIDIPLNHSEKDDDAGDVNTCSAKDRLLTTTHDNVCIC